MIGPSPLSDVKTLAPGAADCVRAPNLRHSPPSCLPRFAVGEGRPDVRKGSSGRVPGGPIVLPGLWRRIVVIYVTGACSSLPDDILSVQPFAARGRGTRTQAAVRHSPQPGRVPGSVAVRYRSLPRCRTHQEPASFTYFHSAWRVVSGASSEPARRLWTPAASMCMTEPKP